MPFLFLAVVCLTLCFFCRCGFVHEYSPRAIIRSEIFCPPLKKVARLAEIRNPDWLYVALKEFVENLYFRYLAVNPKERKVVIVESIFCPTYFRKTLANVLFYHFDVSICLFIGNLVLTPLLTDTWSSCCTSASNDTDAAATPVSLSR